ncbi:MAG TPA: ECF-type sigma factor [Bryobacteraceae bacterium]
MSPLVPELLERLRRGEESALNQLVSVLYSELHRIAARQVRGERPDHTLQPTALVHEAYLKLFDGSQRDFAGQVHFLAVASRVMRQVLVDYARARSTQKRDAGERVPLTTGLEIEAGNENEIVEVIALDEALSALAAEDETLARFVEMRYFGGMTAEETAEALGLSAHVVRHDLRLAQAWLRRKMSSPQ